jgi:predicted lipoprotein
MFPRARPTLMATALVLGLAGSLAGCKIVAVGDKAAVDPSDPNNFDAKKYVSSIWDQKALPFFHDKSHPIGEVLAAIAKDKEAAGKAMGHQANPGGTPWTFAVSGKGTVKALSSGSKHALMTVSVGDGGQAAEVTLQVGPVVFGTAIRDALPFIAFGDFVNQIQYAEVSRALNDRAVAAVSKSLSPMPQVGQTVIFDGAMIDPAAAGGITVTPVEIQVEGAK